MPVGKPACRADQLLGCMLAVIPPVRYVLRPAAHEQVLVIDSAPVLFAICSAKDPSAPYACWDNPDMVPGNNYYIDSPGALLRCRRRRRRCAAASAEKNAGWQSALAHDES